MAKSSKTVLMHTGIYFTHFKYSFNINNLIIPSLCLAYVMLVMQAISAQISLIIIIRCIQNAFATIRRMRLNPAAARFSVKNLTYREKLHN